MTLDPLHSLYRRVNHRIVEFRDRKFLSKGYYSVGVGNLNPLSNFTLFLLSKRLNQTKIIFNKEGVLD